MWPFKSKHKWSKWEEYVYSYTYTAGRFHAKVNQGKQFKAAENWQKRTCEVCGETQREEIKGSYGQ